MKPPPQQRPPGAADAALQAAAFALQNGRFADVERIAHELLQKNPGDAQAAQLYGYALTAQQRGSEAIVPLERAAQQNKDPAVDTQLGLALRQAGRKEEALERFARAVKRPQPFPPAFLEYGSVLIDAGRIDEALEVLKRGIALAPNFGEMQMQLGRAYLARGDNVNARQAYARALERAPAHPDTIFAVARALHQAGDFAEAAETYRRLLAIVPDDAASHIGLGVCLIELGRADDGYASLRRAAQTNAKMYGEALTALVSSGHGRFWLRPGDAEKFLRGKKA